MNVVCWGECMVRLPIEGLNPYQPSFHRLKVDPTPAPLLPPSEYCTKIVSKSPVIGKGKNESEKKIKIKIKTYVEFPTPESSKTFGLPMAPAATITSFPTYTRLCSPCGPVWVNSTPTAFTRGGCAVDAFAIAFADLGFCGDCSQRIRLTRTSVNTVRLGRSAKGV